MPGPTSYASTSSTRFGDVGEVANAPKFTTRRGALASRGKKPVREGHDRAPCPPSATSAPREIANHRYAKPLRQAPPTIQFAAYRHGRDGGGACQTVCPCMPHTLARRQRGSDPHG